MMDDERLRCCTANLFVKFCSSAEELRSTALGAIRSPLRDINPNDGYYTNRTSYPNNNSKKQLKSLKEI